MAPEYAMRGYLTDKADVYSFGVVAFEIVSGRSNGSFRPKEERAYLLDWVNFNSLSLLHLLLLIISTVTVRIFSFFERNAQTL